MLRKFALRSSFEWVGTRADSRSRGALQWSLPELHIGGVVHQISVILNGTMLHRCLRPPVKTRWQVFQPEEIQSYSCTNWWRPFDHPVAGQDKSERKNRSPRKDRTPNSSILIYPSPAKWIWAF